MVAKVFAFTVVLYGNEYLRLVYLMYGERLLSWLPRVCSHELSWVFYNRVRKVNWCKLCLHIQLGWQAIKTFIQSQVNTCRRSSIEQWLKGSTWPLLQKVYTTPVGYVGTCVCMQRTCCTIIQWLHEGAQTFCTRPGVGLGELCWHNFLS